MEFNDLVNMSSEFFYFNYHSAVITAFILIQKYKADISDLELLGELGNGTCGHVVKMRHKPSSQVIAVKVFGVDLYAVMSDYFKIGCFSY